MSDPPSRRFFNSSAASGILLGIAALVGLLWANSPWRDAYHHLWELRLAVHVGPFAVDKTLHHWINDGLMAMFFFVVGLELKRELMAGTLSTVREAALPVVAAVGGMVLPAVLYRAFAAGTNAAAGWGIPMATDIAFALGVLYLLGPRVPVTLKVFLTAVAVADDLGAVLVIALFYTSEVSVANLGIGAAVMAVLLAGNRLGVRHTAFYGVLGIGGLWLAFLLSGVHATVAGVLAAMTIPANVKVEDREFVERAVALTEEFAQSEPNEVTLVTPQQLHLLDAIRSLAREALTPLQRLEHALHPVVAFLVMPIFALANAGVTLTREAWIGLVEPIGLGIAAGLVLGKWLGITGAVRLMLATRIAVLPAGMSMRHVHGVALLAGIGFTMSLFITELAFRDPQLIDQAKVAIIAASLVGGLIGFRVLRGTPNATAR